MPLPGWPVRRARLNSKKFAGQAAESDPNASLRSGRGRNRFNVGG